MMVLCVSSSAIACAMSCALWCLVIGGFLSFTSIGVSSCSVAM